MVFSHPKHSSIRFRLRWLTVTRLPRGPAVDGAATTATNILCDVWRNLHVAALGDEIRRIERRCRSEVRWKLGWWMTRAW